jgi:hypothetical protein
MIFMWNDSFSFTFVEPATMTPLEQAVFAWTGEIASLTLTCPGGMSRNRQLRGQGDARRR